VCCCRVWDHYEHHYDATSVDVGHLDGSPKDCTEVGKGAWDWWKCVWWGSRRQNRAWSAVVALPSFVFAMFTDRGQMSELYEGFMNELLPMSPVISFYVMFLAFYALGMKHTWPLYQLECF
jgi:hypothetical protein